MFKKINTLTASLLLIIIVVFTGCDSTEQSTVIDKSEISEPIFHAAIIVDGRSYDYLELNGFSELSFKAYWPSDTAVSDAYLDPILSHLLIIDQALKKYLPLSISNFNNKKIIFTPLNNVNQNSVAFERIHDESLQVLLPNGEEIIDDYFTQRILSFLYRSDRSIKTEETSIFSKIVTTGLTLHFVEEALGTNDLYQNVEIDESSLKEALGKVKASLSDAGEQSHWFEPEGIGAPVGYYLANQHFRNYPGSNASNTLGLKSNVFMPWLDSIADNNHKIEQYVRTADVENQVKVSELTRQANKFFGSYFLEGYNQEKLVALTFDDGPSQYTEKILDVLEKADVKASFFWQGKNLAGYVEVIKRSILAGHTIANHSWNHPHSAGYSTQVLWQQQVLRTNIEMESLFGFTPRFYRPPYGEVSDEQVEFLEEKGMKVMLWSVDSRDWNPETNSIKHIQSEIINHQHEEMITLMHDSGGNRQNTVDALPSIIEHYKNQGYHFVNLQTLLGISDKG